MLSFFPIDFQAREFILFLNAYKTINDLMRKTLLNYILIVFNTLQFVLVLLFFYIIYWKN